MAEQVNVCVATLAGSSVEKEMNASDSFGILREYIATEWSLDAKAFRLLSGSVVLEDTAKVQSLEISEDRCLRLQLVMFDPLPNLGIFDTDMHSGINSAADGSRLWKTSGRPDSNNVFLKHHIREPCFVEFLVEKTSDEISLGVTYNRKRVEGLSGFANLREKSTWIYSKSKSMPALQFGGQGDCEALRNIPGVVEGDRIAVYVDPSERVVKFYKNGENVASNLPDHPLPQSDTPLFMYVMLDEIDDAVQILRFGPGEP